MRKRTTPQPSQSLEVPRKKTMWTRGETLAQEEFVFQGIVSSLDFNTVCAAFRKTFEGAGRQRFQMLHERVLTRLKENQREQQKIEQLTAIQRTKHRLARLHTTLDQFDPKKKDNIREMATVDARILANEALLADLTGAREPIKVEVDVRVKESLIAVFVNATPADMNRRLEEQHELRRLARLAEASIDTAAE
jgi:hypothetical protein